MNRTYQFILVAIITIAVVYNWVMWGHDYVYPPLDCTLYQVHYNDDGVMTGATCMAWG